MRNTSLGHTCSKSPKFNQIRWTKFHTQVLIKQGGNPRIVELWLVETKTKVFPFFQLLCFLVVTFIDRMDEIKIDSIKSPKVEKTGIASFDRISFMDRRELEAIGVVWGDKGT